jgi:anti-sigma B factor antagonist
MHGDPMATSSDFLQLRWRPQDATLDFVVTGDLDMAAAFELETRFETVAGAEGVKSVTMDLAGVGFVDSAGLGALIATRERAKQLGVELRITRVSGPVRRVLDLTGLGDLAEG